MRIESSQTALPEPLAAVVAEYHWQQVFTGCSTSQVFRLVRSDRECLYLKIADRTFDRQLLEEKLRLEWLRGRLPVPQVQMFIEDESCDYLLLSEVPGITASHDACRKDPLKVIEQLSVGLAMIHSLSIRHCPFNESLHHKVEQARQRVIRGLVDESDFDEPRVGRPAVELYEELIASMPSDEELVFTHGDYCLPNVILHDWKLSGFIDVGRAGIADRYQDIALCARSVAFNYGQEWVEHLYTACRIKPDPAKIHFYTLLDEFF